MLSSSLSIVLIWASLGGPDHFYLPPFVFDCQRGDIIFPFTIWTLLQCWKSSTRRSTVRHWTSPLHYYCKVTHRGKETQRSKEAQAVNPTSHQPDKLPSWPPATMLSLNSNRRAGMTNSSLYPPKINHGTKLEGDTDFSKEKSWVGGWSLGNILKTSQVAWAGDYWTNSQDQILPWKLSWQRQLQRLVGYGGIYGILLYIKYALISSISHSLIHLYTSVSFKDFHKLFMFGDHSRFFQKPCIKNSQ